MPWRPRPQQGWVGGNRVELLVNGEQFFPSVFAAIEAAEREVLIETFILFEDKVGTELRRVLIAAAQRGVRVDLSVDGWGSPDLSDAFVGGLADAGVKLRAFDPLPKILGMRLNMFRRMHRKIAVVDGRIAFVGGINYSADHLGDFGPEAKQDYSVRIEGPLVAQVRRFVLAQIGDAARARQQPEPTPAVAGGADAMLVTRDNRHRRDSIERQYRGAIRAARREVIIANAYFFPGYRLLKALRRAAGRGVRVRLVLQGQPDMAIVKHVAELLHAQLVRAGVEIYEYCRRPLHGKVAIVDDEWATVGSSNLDPLSLSLNLEANVMIRDRAFSAGLRDELELLMREHCKRLEPDAVAQHRSGWRVILDTLAYHVTRRFPTWAGWLPAHSPQFEPVALAKPIDAGNADAADASSAPAGERGNAVGDAR